MGGRDALLSGFVRPDNQKCAPVIARSRDGELENGQNMSKPFRRLVGPGFRLIPSQIWVGWGHFVRIGTHPLYICACSGFNSIEADQTLVQWAPA